MHAVNVSVEEGGEFHQEQQRKGRVTDVVAAVDATHRAPHVIPALSLLYCCAQSLTHVAAVVTRTCRGLPVILTSPSSFAAPVVLLCPASLGCSPVQCQCPAVDGAGLCSCSSVTERGRPLSVRGRTPATAGHRFCSR